MDLAGLALCSRYSYPPNSLSLCGPDKKGELEWYSTFQQADRGTFEILSQFSTLFPYLTLIASENRIVDPFDRRVVEAYWLGNKLLFHVPMTSFIRHLSETLKLRKKIKSKELESVFSKLASGAVPHHSFHVLSIYKRTGHIDIEQTVNTMDACLINWGKIKKVRKRSLLVETKSLAIKENKLIFGQLTERIVFAQGERDVPFSKLRVGDIVSYHWGYFCQKLALHQLRNLIYYTNLSINLANIS